VRKERYRTTISRKTKYFVLECNHREFAGGRWGTTSTEEKIRGIGNILLGLFGWTVMIKNKE